MIELVYFLGGAFLTYVVSQPGLELLSKVRRHITWRRFRRALKKTFVDEFEKLDWRPDVIVGLNSGIVAAGILALNLRIPEIYFYNILPIFRGGQRVQPAVPDKGISLAGKNVLLVDDQLYTGKSMDELYNHLVRDASAEPERIKRYAVFRFKSAAGRVQHLEIPEGGHVLGSVKGVPWIFAKDLERHWGRRERVD